MAVRFGIIVFPGSNCDHDALHAVEASLGQEARMIWHKDKKLGDVDVVIVPGGFSYGDYLRSGAIASFSPIMNDVIRFAQEGGLVLGICNGFQVLCESGLLPGTLQRNDSLRFACKWTHLRVDQTETPFTNATVPGTVLEIPIAHGEGRYYADEETLNRLESNGQIVFRYCSKEGDVTPAVNPNGSVRNIAGIINEEGNVLGMMPHPERCVEQALGGADGAVIFQSLLNHFERVAA